MLVSEVDSFLADSEVGKIFSSSDDIPLGAIPLTPQEYELTALNSSIMSEFSKAKRLLDKIALYNAPTTAGVSRSFNDEDFEIMNRRIDDARKKAGEINSWKTKFDVITKGVDGDFSNFKRTISNSEKVCMQVYRDLDLFLKKIIPSNPNKINNLILENLTK
jgi:hypothetical protein